MKISSKITAVALSAVMVGSALCGCAQATVFGSYPQDLSWSYKDDVSTMKIGEYIYYSYNSYYSASNMVENSNGNFMDQKVKDDDGKEMTAEEYIKKNTEMACKNYLYVNKMFNDMKLSLTADEITGYKANADYYWTSAKSELESYGVSKESFVSAGYENSVKLEAIFKALYQEGGKKEVKLADLQKYYEENYTDYSYISMPLYDSTTDEKTSETKNTKKSDDDVKKIKANFDKYAKAINDGTAYADEAKVYMEDYKVESDPSVSNTEILKDSSLGDEIKKSLEKLKEGTAEYVVVGEDGETPMIYLVYKGKIKDKSAGLKDNESTRYMALVNMKSEEFQKDMKAGAEKYTCEVNQNAIDKYPATMFIVETETEAVQPTQAEK